MTKKFVIITMPRSGSRMLSSALNFKDRDREFLCWNEILRPDILNKKQQIGHPDNSIFADCDKNNEVSIIDKILSIDSHKVIAAGFVAHFWNGLTITNRKHELTDSLNPWPYLMKHKDKFNFILLTRNNLLNRYISHILANGGEDSSQEPCWHLFNQEDKRNIRIYINKEKAIENIKEAKLKIQGIKELFNSHSIKYEEMTENVFDYIIEHTIYYSTGYMCSSEIKFKPATSKIIKDYSEVVENWEEIKDLQ